MNRFERPPEGAEMGKFKPLRTGLALALLAAPALAESISIKLAPGETAGFTLQENPTTGYVWRLDPDKSQNAGVVRLDDLGFSPPQQKPGAPPIVGAPGVHKWSVIALASGQAKLVLVLERPWEKGKAPAQTQEVDASVK
ncbi:protease inhibitor I42 family protein [Methylocystis heyeri]|uniref:Chagasin n=1 Tax=Methylocystis heyeri TaxID=391905 RepID=A0A6B8KGV0_9HYPH|nr:protease inhibitor I42 family protein [Methylocystis heyeri]QGM45703.1 chagasin [Methylocystis heyeri]